MTAPTFTQVGPNGSNTSSVHENRVTELAHSKPGLGAHTTSGFNPDSWYSLLAGKTHASNERIGPGSSRRSSEWLSSLFREQALLNKRVRSQARLLKVEVPDVVSVQTVRLDRINNEIVAYSANLAAKQQPGQYTKSFKKRPRTEAQENLDLLISRQGVKHLVGNPSRENLKFSQSMPVTLPTRNDHPRVKIHEGDHFKFGLLEGPALRLYLKAVSRGYRGGPHNWVRSRYSRQALPALARKGLIGPPEKAILNVFDSRSPLRFVLRTNIKVGVDVRHGFHGERLTPYGDISVLARQKRGPRLTSKEWPSDEFGRSFWPSTPTLMESWEMFVRGVGPRTFRDSATSVFHRISDSELRENSELARAIVSYNVIGIRGWVPIPEKLRWYFKYRWGFLILRPRIRLPMSVVRFVLATWRLCPLQCFLLEGLTLRKFLRTRVPSRLITETAFANGPLKNFFGAARPRGEEEPDSIRPVSTMRFIKPMVAADTFRKGVSVGTPSRRVLLGRRI